MKVVHNRPVNSRALSVQRTLSAVCLAIVLVIWASTGFGHYFWPMWPALGLSIALGLHAAVRWSLSIANRGERRLALHGSISAVIATAQLVIWAFSGGGFFWPVFPILGLGVLFVLHVLFAPPQQTELAGRVDELARTRRGALDLQASELRRIERDLRA